MTNYTRRDYDWVLKIIKKHKGISPKDVVRIAQDESSVLGRRPRDEKPPGRDKIYEIVNDGSDKDWVYMKGGGKSKNSSLLAKETEPLAGLEPALTHLMIFEKIKRLDILYKKRNKKFSINDLLELSLIKNSIMSFPMYAYYSDIRLRSDRDLIFQNATEAAQKQLDRIKTIERTQTKKFKEFKKIQRSIDKLHFSDLIYSEVLKNKKDFKGYLKERNFLQDTFKIK